MLGKHSKVVSLSHPITARIPLWPRDPPVVFKDVACLEKDGYFLRRFSMGEHSATHMNAPNSFYIFKRDLFMIFKGHVKLFNIETK